MLTFLVTAGPTREPLDPVRFLTNRSSGKMGYAIASEALSRGHKVILISGPVCLTPHEGIELIHVTTAEEMHEAVHRYLGHVDVAVFAAAVADYRPETQSTRKIKKSGDNLVIKLVPNPDILASARTRGYRGVLVGFAAETDNVIDNATSKMQAKGCDLIVANDVSKAGIGFDADENEITLCFSDGTIQQLPRGSKINLAGELIQIMESLTQSQHD
jgi:phosphopantothenoylcysteine decarboxylase/phosphopantothenate--cysteine ligase